MALTIYENENAVYLEYGGIKWLDYERELFSDFRIKKHGMETHVSERSLLRLQYQVRIA